METELISTTDVAIAYGVDRSTITRWVKSGRLSPAITVPGYRGNFLFTPDALPEPPQ